MGGFIWSKALDDIVKDVTRGTDGLLFAAGEAKRLMEPYVPMDTGELARSAQVSAAADKGRVVYGAAHAADCYYGQFINFKTDKHPLAGAYWDRAMTVAHKGQLVQNVGGYLKGVR